MRYAIVESGGKQYKAVEGQAIEVDRLSDEAGAQVDLRTLLMADGEDFKVGTPTVTGIQVKATILGHFRGDKVIRFKYSPKKRIRVRGGHRQQYTRLMVDFIGRPGESRKVEKAAAIETTEAEPKLKVEKSAKPASKEVSKRSAEKKTPVKKTKTAGQAASNKSSKQ